MIELGNKIAFELKIHREKENRDIINKVGWRAHFIGTKTILGKKLRSRREESRHVETVIGCNILNQFLELGRCKSEIVL